MNNYLSSVEEVMNAYREKHNTISINSEDWNKFCESILYGHYEGLEFSPDESDMNEDIYPDWLEKFNEELDSYVFYLNDTMYVYEWVEKEVRDNLYNYKVKPDEVDTFMQLQQEYNSERPEAGGFTFFPYFYENALIISKAKDMIYTLSNVSNDELIFIFGEELGNAIYAYLF